MRNRNFIAFLLSITCCLNGTVFGSNKAPSAKKNSMSSSLHLCDSKGISLSTIMDKVMSAPLDPCELVDFSVDDLRLIRNMIYAKHGREFNDPKIKAYFESQAWYTSDSNFSEDSLSEIQQVNVRVCKELEEINTVLIPKNRKGTGPAVQRTAQDNFSAYDMFLHPLKNNARVLEKMEGKWKAIFESKKLHLNFARENTYVQGKPKLVLLPQNAGVCMMYPILDKQGVVRHCATDIYTLEGQHINSIPFCPTHVFKENLNLYLRIENDGDCGTCDWKINFFNAITQEKLSYFCSQGMGNCDDFLITWIPAIKRILFVATYGSSAVKDHPSPKMEINLIDQDGNLTTYGTIKNVPSADTSFYRIHSLVAIKELQPNSKWLLRFIYKDQNKYLLLSAFPSANKPPTIFILSNPSGKAVTVEERQDELSPEEEETLAVIIISAEFSGSNVKIDEQEIQIFPSMVYFKPGIHKIIMKKKGQFDIKVDIDFKPGQKLDMYKHFKPLLFNRLRD